MTPRACANPRCGRPLPAHAPATQRHCSAACRQARHRERGRPTPNDRQRAALAQHFRATAELLAAAANNAATAGPEALSAHVPALAALLDTLTVTAVAHDREHGDSWPVIAARLHLEPETARRRHVNKRHRAADLPPQATGTATRT
ncbi:hypothetical protein [Yinghuangia sp. YIM S09857]|uniref:hypothetical protein n=1 Tax=Yinghuangia sp. YIM S09857 TaxID=3436929 RepID=UPI003F536CF0